MPTENTPHQPKKQGKSKPITLYPHTVEEALQRTLDAGLSPGKQAKKRKMDTPKQTDDSKKPPEKE
jgi:hypothetical protein